MADIKQIIDDNIYQNGQQRIAGIVMNSVLKAMVDDTDEKVGDLTQEMSQIGAVVLALFKKAVYVGNVTSEIAELERLLGISSKAICGECLCGEVLCGQI